MMMMIFNIIDDDDVVACLRGVRYMINILVRPIISNNNNIKNTTIINSR